MTIELIWENEPIFRAHNMRIAQPIRSVQHVRLPYEVQPTTRCNVILRACTRTAVWAKSLVDPHPLSSMQAWPTNLYNFCVGVPSLRLNECGRIPCIISHTTNANHPSPRDLVLATLAPFSSVYVQKTTGYNVIFRECTRTAMCTKSKKSG